MVCLCSFVYVACFFVICSISAIVLPIVLLRQFIKWKVQKRRADDPSTYVGLFHPYCNAGGGGERVLWCAIKALQNKYPEIKIIVYTGDIGITPADILRKSRNTFNVSVDDNRVTFVYLQRRHYVEADKYPRFTLLGQSLGSVVLGIEALWKHQPDIYVDTMGYAFTLPLFRYIGGCRVGCYVHYPTISTDMVRKVRTRVYAHNNSALVVRNPFLTYMKLAYYKLFAKVYSTVGRCSESIMVNSSWTENHINDLWKVPFRTHRVYPPCEVGHLKNLQLTEAEDKINILSIGQFRPEKDHPLQLQALYELRTLLNNDEETWNKVKLIIVGSCRNDEDTERMQNMKDFARHLSLDESVEFRVNVSHQELIQCFQSAQIGIHTMWNEHFGIGVVECMAAGLIMVANRSGGPLMDIIETSVGSRTGYLAVDALDYAECIATIIYSTKEENDAIRNAARASIEQFSEKEFEKELLRASAPLFET